MGATLRWTLNRLLDITPVPRGRASRDEGAHRRRAESDRKNSSAGFSVLVALASVSLALSGCAQSAQSARGGLLPIDASTDPRALLDCPRGTAVTQGLTAGVLSSVYCERPNGVRHGPYLEWWPNKYKKTVGQYKEGQRDGTWSFFTQTGALESQVNYQSGQSSPGSPGSPAAPPTPGAPVNPSNPATSPAPPP